MCKGKKKNMKVAHIHHVRGDQVSHPTRELSRKLENNTSILHTMHGQEL